jgi:hypothetical protein
VVGTAVDHLQAGLVRHHHGQDPLVHVCRGEKLWLRAPGTGRARVAQG